jgi:hypothetical protein
MLDVPKYPDAKLYPSEVVTLALLYAIQGGGTRAFYGWLTRDSTDTSCHAKDGDPANMKVYPWGTWNTRMLVKTVLSMLTTVFQIKKMGHRVWASCRARVAWTMAVFNLLAHWGLDIDDKNMVRLSIAEFGL